MRGLYCCLGGLRAGHSYCMWSARQKVRQETRDTLGKYETYDAMPSNVTLSFDEGGLNSDEDFERLAEKHGVDVTDNDGQSVHVHGRTQDIRALAYEVEERHGAAPDITVMASENADPAWSEDIDDYSDSEEVTARITPGDAEAETPDEEVRYSFLKEFETAEEKFNADFEGVPNRFFNANLRGDIPTRRGRPRWHPGDIEVRDKVIDENLDLHEFTERMAGDDDAHRHLVMFDHRGTAERLCKSAGAPGENAMSDEDAEQLLESIPGAVKVERGSERVTRLMRGKATRSWVVSIENDEGEVGKMIVSDGGTTVMGRSYVRGGTPEPLEPNDWFTRADLRMVAGNERIRRKTGHNLLGDLTTQKDEKLSSAEIGQGKIGVLAAMRDMEDAQGEGRNFIAQRKYITSQNSKIATAFDDKKNPDKTRQQMMAETSLSADNGGSFTKVEIDNDVDPDEYADFERAYHDIADKLPSSNGRSPDLRIRKLGKHRANGVFNPQRNTVAIDVRTSEAFIHEMGHHLDLVANKNASLSSEFRQISRQYSASLDEPDSSHRDYLNTPTEQLARGFEVYAVERLGINNRLVNPSKFDRNDYAPYTENPELKSQLFDFFDKTFAKQ